MDKKIVIIGIFLLFIIAAAALVFYGFRKLNLSNNTSSENIVLYSQASGFNLEFNNKQNLQQIIDSRGIFQKGIYNPKIGSYQKINQVAITLTTNIQPNLAIDIGNNTIITSASSSIIGDVFNLNIYLRPGLDNLQNIKYRDSIFNSEFVRALVVATPDPNMGGNTVNTDIDSLIKKYVPSGTQNITTSYPMSIKNK